MTISERSLRFTLFGLGIIGLGVAIYLTTVHYAGEEPVCLAGGGGCSKVQNSDYAELIGIPVPLLGVFGYLTVIAASLVPGDPGRLLGVFAGLVGAGFSLYLTYLELFVIDAICQWCVASAVIMGLVLAVTLLRAMRYAGRGPAPPTLSTN